LAGFWLLGRYHGSASIRPLFGISFWLTSKIIAGIL
jgi:hypothetical protein